MIEVINMPVSPKAKRASWKDYPFATMQVGDGFYLHKGTFERKKFSVMLNSVGKRLSVKFSTSTDKVNGSLFVQRVL
jgi:hypothetical protein